MPLNQDATLRFVPHQSRVGSVMDANDSPEAAAEPKGQWAERYSPIPVQSVLTGSIATAV